MDEVLTKPSEWGPKPKCKVKVTNGIDTYEKTWTLNQQNTNYLSETHGKESKGWIGKKVAIYTEFIKGNDSIRIKAVN